MPFDVGFVLVKQHRPSLARSLATPALSSSGRIEAIIHYYHIIFPVYELKIRKTGGKSQFLFVLGWLTQFSRALVLGFK